MPRGTGFQPVLGGVKSPALLGLLDDGDAHGRRRKNIRWSEPSAVS
jgi:hypothetical protein